MRAIIAAGGTAGHINPALAIANEIMRDAPDSRVLFVGRQDGMEYLLVPQAGYEFIHIETHGFERKFTPAAILSNINTLWHVLRAGQKARRLFREFKPDVVIGCGGYVSGPIVRKAAKMGIPTVIQEQNAYPGITTRLLAKIVDIVFVPSADAVERMPRSEKCVVAGNPIRDDFLAADRRYYRGAWNIGGRTCVVSFGGSLGAHTINEIAVRFMKLHADSDKVFHIHATGQYGTSSVPELMRQYGVDETSPNLRVGEYIDNMPGCFAAADLIVSRAGAVTISELAAVGRASVLIPSPNVAENHQYYNALILRNLDAAVVFEENDIDADVVARTLWALAQDKERLAEMGENARRAAIPDSARLIYQHIKTLVAERKEAR